MASLQPRFQSEFKATAIGYSAILMWSTLALLTKLSGDIPPFQLTAMAFTIAFLIGLILWFCQGGKIVQRLKLPLVVWGLGIFGLFGYHFVYFLALQHAPAVEASLIAYLWPLFIVVFSTFLPHERLHWFHGVGAALGFMGATLLVTKGQTITFNTDYLIGYIAAFLCALIWSIYSVLSRRFGAIPTDAVGGFCGVTALLAWVCHFAFEPTDYPTGWEWLAILGLGLGPVGLAFFTWDYGVKHGNIKLLGALSYTAPLLSTLLLITCGLATMSWAIALACLLIVGGAIIAAGEFLNGRSR